MQRCSYCNALCGRDRYCSRECARAAHYDTREDYDRDFERDE